MRQYKIKNFFKKAAYWISIYSGFPHLWVTAIIMALSITVLLLSIYFNAYEKPFVSSIFANIFAGLLTGLILFLISGTKQILIAQLMSKKHFLEELVSKIKQYQQAYSDLRSMKFAHYDGSIQLFDFIYDTGSFANWINEFILQSSFDKTLAFKPMEYCKENLNYDAFALIDTYQELHDKLYLVDVETPSKKEILQYFEEIDKKIRGLNSAAHQTIRDIDVRLQAINRSIL